MRGFPFLEMSEFPSFAGRAIEAIRINATSREVRGGKPVLIKQRRLWSGAVARVANAFFRVARHPVYVWEKASDWQQWELHCFNLLHGEQNFEALPEGPRGVCADILPGTSLADHFVKRTFKQEMIDAAALELRRAHGICSEYFGGGFAGARGAWSHGDANLANFLFATTENRARLIDFDVAHHRSLSAEERHAEDLLTFLQDLLGCIENGQDWLPAASRFIDVYGRETAAVDLLRQRLVIPHGAARVWWWIRTNYIPAQKLRHRISTLRWALG